MNRYVIFGAGNIGKRYFEMSEKEGLDVVAFCDNDKKRWGMLYCERPIIPPAMLLEPKYQKCEVIVAIADSKEVCEQLDSMGIAHSNDIRAEMVMRRNKLFYKIDGADVTLAYGQSRDELAVVVDARNCTNNELQNCMASLAANECECTLSIELWNQGMECPQPRGEMILFVDGCSMVSAGALKNLLVKFRQQKGIWGMKEIDFNRCIIQAGYEYKDGEWSACGEGEACLSAPYSYVKEVGCLKGNGILMPNECWVMFKKNILEGSGIEQSWIEMQSEAKKRGYQLLLQPQALLWSDAEDAKEWTKRMVNVLKDTAVLRDPHVKERVLMLDIIVAEFDTNAGHRTTHSYIQLLLEMGKEVVYLLEYVDLVSPYVEYYQQQGVFVVYDEQYNGKCEKFLLNEVGNITYAFVNRPQMAYKYVPILRKWKDMKIVHYGHDLHYLRLLREYDYTGDERKKEEAMKMKNEEFSIVSQVDYTGYPSDVEVNILKKEFPNANIECFPMIYFEDFPVIPKRENTSGIVFVGGYGHTPNVDAACWLVEEIVPELRRRGVSDKVYLVGSKPTEKILAFANDEIVVTGYVTEDELREIYNKCRISIAPLRYGAGMKGKVLEAMYNGIPLVTTDIGAEGLTGVEQVISVGNTVSEIADAVERIGLYSGEELQRVLYSAQDYVKERFGKDKIKNMLLRQMKGE